MTHIHICPHCGGHFQCENNCQKPETYTCLTCTLAVPDLALCAGCDEEKPLVKWLNDEGVFVWLGLNCAAAKGNPKALHIKTMQWIDGLLQPIQNLERIM